MEHASRLLQDGIRAERLGALDRALERYAEAADSGVPAVVAEALTRQADIHRLRADWDAALESARRAQAVARDAQHVDLVETAIVAEANVLMCRGDFGEALALFGQVLGASEDQRTRGIALQNIGSIHAQQGHLVRADRAFAESYGCFRRAGYRRGEAIALNNRGRVMLDRGDVAQAELLLEESVDLARAEEDMELMALASVNLAEVFTERGDFSRAEELASSALGYFRSCGNRWREVECLRLLGDVSRRVGGTDDARRCFELALRMAEAIGAQKEIAELRRKLAALGPGLPNGYRRRLTPPRL